MRKLAIFIIGIIAACFWLMPKTQADEKTLVANYIQYESLTFQDSVVYKDSVRLALEEKTRKAWKRSLIIPGWGQITNGGLWWIKVPVTYGGFATTVIVFDFNNKYYKSLLKDVQYRLANNHAIPPN